MRERDEPGRAVAAVFASHEEGREALRALQKARVGALWFATTSIAETDRGMPAVTVETSGFFRKTQNLVDALVHNGVAGVDARELCDTIQVGSSVVTVEPTNASIAEARAIVERFGGYLAGASRGRRFDARSRAMLIVETTAMDLEALAELDEEAFYRR